MNLKELETNKLLLLLALAILLDGATTFFAFTIGLQEGNPIAVAITPQVSLLIRAAIIGFFFVRFSRREVSRYTHAILLIAIIWTWLVVASNLSMIVYKSVIL